MMASRSYRHALGMGLLAALLWLGGCGPGSAKTLRDASHKTYSFEVAADYQVVHERILLRARQRYVFVQKATFQPGVSANLSPERQSSTITLWDSGKIGIRYRLIAETRAIAPGRTQVDLYTAGRRDRGEARLWAGWADTPLKE